jgi:hypothetical protein
MLVLLRNGGPSRLAARTAMASPLHRPTAPTQLETIEHLRELVDAIDKRSWHFERKGEVDIARDAAALRKKALERIAELERTHH